MPVRITSASFAAYIAAQSTTRVSKVREAKRMMAAPHDDFKRMDYWLTMRDAAVGRLTGSLTARQFENAIAGVTDSKKTSNYQAVASGLQKWIGRKSISATTAKPRTWTSADLEVSVTPELLLSISSADPLVVKLYFRSEPLSKYQANPLLRLIELTHGKQGTAAVLDTRQSKLHVGPTLRPRDLDILLKTEAASFVSIWNSL